MGTCLFRLLLLVVAVHLASSVHLFSATNQDEDSTLTALVLVSDNPSLMTIVKQRIMELLWKMKRQLATSSFSLQGQMPYFDEDLLYTKFIHTGYGDFHYQLTRNSSNSRSSGRGRV